MSCRAHGANLNMLLACPLVAFSELFRKAEWK